jgi:hypothetical protein
MSLRVCVGCRAPSLSLEASFPGSFTLRDKKNRREIEKGSIGIVLSAATAPHNAAAAASRRHPLHLASLAPRRSRRLRRCSSHKRHRWSSPPLRHCSPRCRCSSLQRCPLPLSPPTAPLLLQLYCRGRTRAGGGSIRPHEHRRRGLHTMLHQSAKLPHQSRGGTLANDGSANGQPNRWITVELLSLIRCALSPARA